MKHITPKLELKECNAQTLETCPFRETGHGHFASAEEGSIALADLLEKKYGEQAPKTAKFSFVREFKKKEEEFNERFGGLSKSFFKADLIGNTLGKWHKFGSNEAFLEGIEDVDMMSVYGTQHDNMVARMMQVTSSPSDALISDEDAVKNMEAAGITNIRKLSDADIEFLRKKTVTRGWIGEVNGEQMLITDKKFGRQLGRFYLRSRNSNFPSSFYGMDLRSVAGAVRVERLSGVRLIESEMGNRAFRGSSEDRKPLRENAKESLRRVIIDLSKAQFEGSNFLAQKKYIKENSGSVATAWDDKKNPVHADLMRETRARQYFAKVEIDDDVNPGEYEKFLKGYEKAREYMPKVPAGLEPTLRIRKLGKHNSHNFIVSGLFNPAKNAVAVDIRDSSSMAHEMFHHYDMVVLNNESLSDEFRELSRGYNKRFKPPHYVSASRAEYYRVATEQFARMGEVWLAHKMGGQSNEVVDPDRFNDFDYSPITGDEEFKQKVFAFFDKIAA